MTAATLRIFMSGGIFMGFLVASFFFFRFWRRSKDRFFAIFALAFVVLSFERILVFVGSPEENRNGIIYTIRLLAFLCMAGAIVDKNRGTESILRSKSR
jgi:hypothetical protein